LLILALVAYRYQKKRLSKKICYAAVIIFLVCATPFLPKFLAGRLEKQFRPFDTLAIKQQTGKVYIHLLGSGFTDDERLPATGQLGIVAQSRLIEAIRIYRQLNNSVLVCSAGTSSSKSETQAAVAKKAAILLGVDSSRIITLDTPATTKEEAIALSKRVGSAAMVIIVTDAIHMPRAYKFFSEQGFHPVAAPTNFKVLKSRHNPSFSWAPSISNISLMDVLIHEYLANLKALFL
jgi:uncharacterized SAM-binding protein YcdF (DUF218 family)